MRGWSEVLVAGGWEPLEDFHYALMESRRVQALWDAKANGDRNTVMRILIDELGYDLDETAPVFLFVTPDAIHGDYYEAWVPV